MYSLHELADLFDVPIDVVAAAVASHPANGVGDGRRVSHLTAAAIATALGKSL